MQLPTSDGVKVDIEGQALFTLNLEPRALLEFYRRYGTRTFQGLHAYDGDDGWSAFLDDGRRGQPQHRHGPAEHRPDPSDRPLVDPGRPVLHERPLQPPGISLPGIQNNIDRANAAKADVATARFEANRKVEQAIGDRRVAEQKARAIAATRTAYRSNPAQARIDAIRALPQRLQALGGNTSQLLGPASGK